jgi:hypothetical protein
MTCTGFLAALATSMPLVLHGAEAAAPTGVESAEQIIATPATDESYLDTYRCLRADKIARTRVLSNRHVVFEMRRAERWLVQLPVACPGLTPGTRVALQRGGSGLCDTDFVRPIQETGLGTGRLGPPCRLARFEPVTREQVEALRQALRGDNAAGR